MDPCWLWPMAAHPTSRLPRACASNSWYFNGAGDFEFGCLISSYCEAGMRGNIRMLP